MSDYVLPSDRISFENQIELLRAYAAHSGAFKKAVSNKDVAQNVKIIASTASLVNSFFSSVGFIVKGEGGYIPSDDVFNYKNQFELGNKHAGKMLRLPLAKMWFWAALHPILDMRSMEVTEAISKLAEVAGLGAKDKPRLEMLIQFLDFSELIRREGTQIQIVKDAETPNYKPPVDGLGGKTENMNPKDFYPDPSELIFNQQAGGITVEIRVNPTKVKGWDENRFLKFFQGIATVVSQAVIDEVSNNN